MTICCQRCGCIMQGPVLDREHETLRFACPCCPAVIELEASAADVARLNNVVTLVRRRAASGSR